MTAHRASAASRAFVSFLLVSLAFCACGGSLPGPHVSGARHEDPRIAYFRHAMDAKHRIRCGEEGCSRAADRVCVHELGEFGAAVNFEALDYHGWRNDEAAFDCRESQEKRKAAAHDAWDERRRATREYAGTLDDEGRVARNMLASCRKDEVLEDDEVAEVRRYGARTFACNYVTYPFDRRPKGIAPCRYGARDPGVCMAAEMVLSCRGRDCERVAREWCASASVQVHRRWTVDRSTIREFSRTFEGIEYVHDVAFRCTEGDASTLPPGFRRPSVGGRRFVPREEAPREPRDETPNGESEDGSEDAFTEPSGVVMCGVEMPDDKTYVSRNPRAGALDPDIDESAPLGSFLRPKDDEGVEMRWTYDAASEGTRGDGIVTVHARDTTSDHHVKFRMEVRARAADGRLLHREEKVDFDLSPGEASSVDVRIPHPEGKGSDDDVATLVVRVTKLTCYVPSYDGPLLPRLPARPPMRGDGVQ